MDRLPVTDYLDWLYLRKQRQEQERDGKGKKKFSSMRELMGAMGMAVQKKMISKEEYEKRKAARKSP